MGRKGGRGTPKPAEPPDPETEKLTKVFRSFDGNGDGLISKEELAAVFKVIDPVYWTDQLIDKLMAEADLDGNGTIHYEEFCVWLTCADKEKRAEVMVNAEFLGEKSFNATALIVDCRAIAGQTDRYTVKLEQDTKAKMGVKIDASDARMLVIKVINSGGLFANWNEEANNRQIAVGDMIMAVNGHVENARDMMQEFVAVPSRGYRSLTMEVQPRDGAFRFKNKITDLYDLNSTSVDEEECSTLRYAVHRTTKKPYSVKSVHKRSARRNLAESEIATMKITDHPNIVKLFQVFEDFHDIHLVVEQCAGGELLERILIEERFSEVAAAGVMRKLFGALEHLRSKSICHRDVRPQNILLEEDEVSGYNRSHVTLLEQNLAMERCNPKLTGLGHSRAYASSPASFHTRIGEMEYRPPQMIDGEYDETCDAWSAGVIMYTLLSGYPPFFDETESGTAQLIRNGRLLFPDEEWSSISRESIDLATRLLTYKPEQRCTFAEALQHPWTLNKSPKVDLDVDLKKGQSNLHKFCKLNKLKKAALHCIARQASDTEIDELKELFQLLDKNGDSTVTLNELKDGVERLGKNNKKESWDSLKDIMEGADVDGNKRIDYTEFLAATISQKRFGEETACWAAFECFDKDGSGRINQKELVAVLQSDTVQATFGKTAVDMMLQASDTDGDGEIDFQEFMAMMRGESAEDEYDDL